jgi:FlaA1/EpsC-like NDP-sugar epimerase
MVRFWMSIDRAVDLVLKAAQMAEGEEIFIFKMPALQIRNLAEVMIQKLAPKYGYDPKDIGIKIVGKRRGEKLYEQLMTEEEALNAYETEDMLIVLPQAPIVPPHRKGLKKAVLKTYSAKDTTELKKNQINVLLESILK